MHVHVGGAAIGAQADFLADALSANVFDEMDDAITVDLQQGVALRTDRPVLSFNFKVFNSISEGATYVAVKNDAPLFAGKR